MPKISKESAPNVEDFGPATDLSGPLDDYTVDFVTIRQEHSLAALLQGATRRQLPVPALGLPLRRQDHRHLRGPGRGLPGGRRLPACRPGHVPAAEAGTEFVQFSPTDQLNVVHAHMAAAAQALQGISA